MLEHLYTLAYSNGWDIPGFTLVYSYNWALNMVVLWYITMAGPWNRDVPYGMAGPWNTFILVYIVMAGNWTRAVPVYS